MIWNFDISQAPRGRYIIVSRNNGKLIGPAEVFVPADVILATKCGKVTKSRWLPDEDRWLMLAAGEQPIAWQEWPTHPNSQSAETPTADKPEAHAQPLSDASGSLSKREYSEDEILRDDDVPAFLKREVA